MIPGDQENEDDSQQDQPRPDQISPEDAMRMLDAAEREEQQVQEKLMEKKASEKPLRTGRNW
jgi:Ca-activated chloride channel homolog